MKILYLSCHAILEYDELTILTELGHDVKSHGVYRDPRGAYTLPRPGIPGMEFDQEFFDLTAIHPKTDLTPEMIEPYDVIIIMDGENQAPLISNWERIKHKRVILRTIGQTTSSGERVLQKYKAEGLEIVRYSRKEENIPNYAGADAFIRFAKDPDEFSGWTGEDKRPINFTQSLKARNRFTHYEEIMGAMVGFDGAKVYGTGNADLGSFNGGEMPYEELKRLMRTARCYVYAGTWPAPYTLTFIEAMLTGIPIVAINKKLAHLPELEAINFYEVDEILEQAGITTFDNIGDMRQMIETYIQDEDVAKMASEAQRELAIKLFGKAAISEQWRQFLER